MEFVLNKYGVFCSSTENGQAALLFVFGDFNFRLNASSFLEVIKFYFSQTPIFLSTALYWIAEDHIHVQNN